MWCPICKENGVLNELDDISTKGYGSIFQCDNCGTHFDGKLNIILKAKNNADNNR